jgi:hypothetical protein
MMLLYYGISVKRDNLTMEVFRNARKGNHGLYGVQTAQLRHDEEQEK